MNYEKNQTLISKMNKLIDRRNALIKQDIRNKLLINNPKPNLYLQISKLDGQINYLKLKIEERLQIHEEYLKTKQWYKDNGFI